MHVYNVGHFGFNLTARKGRILEYRCSFKESYKNQPRLKFQCRKAIIRPITHPNLQTTGIYF